MKLIYAEYNPLTNSICLTTFDNYILRIDCNKAEDGLKTTLCHKSYKEFYLKELRNEI